MLTEPGISSVNATVFAKPDVVDVDIANLNLSAGESYQRLPCLVEDAIPEFNSR
jgi:hypothetical protein